MKKTIEEGSHSFPAMSDIVLLALSRGQNFYSTELCRIFASNKVWSPAFRRHLRQFLTTENLAWAEKELRCAQEQGAQCLRYGSEEYPAELYTIADPPLILFCRGTLRAEKRVAVVGARRASRYGTEIASAIGSKLCRNGVAVVSGLAVGIDAAVHEGALCGETEMQTHGQIVAVLGSGLDYIYPRQNRHLYERILNSGGLVMSEYGISSRPAKHLFPRRNRIISGLSAATVVVEAKAKSGSLITAAFANEQGREVFAVPGPIDSPLSRGCNELIAQGATPFLDFACLGSEYARSKDSAEPPDSGGQWDELAAAILSLLRGGVIMSTDEIGSRIPVGDQRIRSELALLELRGAIERTEGDCYARKYKIDIV